jgi:acetyl-CoA synthetase
MMPLQNKLVAAGVPHLMVLDPLEALRPSDFNLNQLLSDQSQTMPAFVAHADDEVNILFSSGTTGEPKALVWTHSTPIKCATDAYFNQNIEVGDVLHWPTNLGWMMGPWVLFAALINRATLALFDGLSNGEAFASFLKQTKVTMLGTVPSLIKVWRDSKLFEAHSFDDLKVLSSTGECSNPADMIYFSWVTGLKPIIEYCGGTEIGGAYVSSYLSEPNVPSCFGGATLGLNFELVQGEVMIVPPSIGLSNRILNRDHRKSYFEGSPQRTGVTLRRHGDELQQIAPQVFRALGRSDDTMNLGGIKVSSAELERAVATLEGLRESAAVAISPEGGGPSQLVYFVVGHWPHDLATIKAHMQQLIRERLNPLFKIFDVVQIDQLPRTASNKVLRRVLRDQYESKGKNR